MLLLQIVFVHYYSSDSSAQLLESSCHALKSTFASAISKIIFWYSEYVESYDLRCTLIQYVPSNV